MDFHGHNYTHSSKQMQWGEDQLAGSWDLTKCVIQEAIKMENHCSPDKQRHIMPVGTYNISLKAKVRLNCSVVRSKLFRSKHTHGPGQVWLNKQKSFCGCSVLVFINDQHWGSGMRDHPGEPQPAEWLYAAAVTRPACHQCFQGHMLLGSLHISKRSLSRKVFLEICEGKRQVGREMGECIAGRH